MILINLLPHREERRRQRKRQFLIGLGIAAVIGAMAVLAWYMVVSQMTSAQRQRNDFLKQQIAMLDTQIKDIATLKGEIDALKARQGAVEDLQTDRNTPVHLLDELVKQTPEGVYLTGVKQNGTSVSVTGIAQTNERVSEFLRNTSYHSQWVERPELVEVKAATVTTATKDQRRLFEFALRLNLKKPLTASAAASAASGAAMAASGAARTAAAPASSAAAKAPA